MMLNWLKLLLLLLSIFAPICREAVGQEKTAVPTTELKTSLDEVKSLFGDKYLEAKKIRAASERKAAYAKLIEEMLRIAESTNKPSDRYALLQVAQQIAVQAQDADTTIEILEEVDRWFKVDILSLKISAMTKIASGLSATEHREIVPRFMDLQQAAVAASRYELAGQLTSSIRASAKQARDARLLTRAQKQIKAVEELVVKHDEYQKAQEVLKNAPDDPASNMVVGKYLCVFKNDWSNGLSYLALGNDADLKTVAGADLTETASPTDAAAWAKIGDNWSRAAEKVEGKEQQAFQKRAVTWYRKALASLPEGGLTHRRVQLRLSELEESAAPEDDELPKFAKDFIGRYFLAAIGKKSQQTMNSIMEFQEDFQVLQDSIPVAKWEVDGGVRIKVVYSESDEPPIYLRPRGTTQPVNGTRTTDTDTWRWELTRLTAVRWEHTSEQIKVFGFDIPETNEVLTFYSNGRINDPLGNLFWKKQGNTISFDRGEDGITVVTIGAGGKSYVGKTKKPIPFRNFKLTIPVTGRLLGASE